MSQYYIGSSPDELYSIKFSQIPAPVCMGEQSNTPFVVSITANDDGPHVVDLYAMRSHSFPREGKEGMWSQLIPTWRFVNSDGTTIDSVTTTDTKIYTGTEYIVSGYAEFGYVDDLATTYREPAFVWATMSMSGRMLLDEAVVALTATGGVPSYANSLVATIAPVDVNTMTQSGISFTRNGLDKLSDGMYWINQHMPLVASVNGSHLREFGQLNHEGSGIVYDYPYSDDGVDVLTACLFDGNYSTSGNQILDLSGSGLPVFTRFEDPSGNNYTIGGYSLCRTIPTIASDTSVISGRLNLSASPSFASYASWVSDPDGGSIYRIRYPHEANNIEILNGFDEYLGNELHIMDFSVASSFAGVTIQTPDLYSVDGVGGIYTIAVDPRYNVWAGDADLSKLYKFDALGNKLCDVSLSSVTSGDVSPCCISIDEFNNLYVSYFDSSLITKHNGITGDVINSLVLSSCYEVSSAYNDSREKPVGLDCARDNTIWVAYASYNKELGYNDCYVKHLDGDLSELGSIQLPVNSYPFDVVCDVDDNVFITLTYPDNVDPNNGELIRIASGEDSYTVLCSGLLSPSHTTVDKSGNIWFVSNNNRVNVCTISDGTTVHSYFSCGSAMNDVPYSSEQNQAFALEGIATDQTDRLWVVNNADNTIYIYDLLDFPVLSGGDITTEVDLVSTNISQKINMPTTQEYVSNQAVPIYDNDVVVGYDYTKSQIGISSDDDIHPLWARGDWTGNRWVMKYLTSFGSITGISEPFKVGDYDEYRVRRHNESWDTTSHMKGFVLSPTFSENTNFFDGYIENMVGGVEHNTYSIGRRLFERIANSVPNLQDIDECGVDGLYSLAHECDVPMDDYLMAYPEDVIRIMDIASVQHKKLWGDRCKCDANYFKSANSEHTKFCNKCFHIHKSNLGQSLDISTVDLSTSRVPYLIENMYNRNIYTRINPSYSSFSAASSVLAQIEDGTYTLNGGDETLSESISALEYDTPEETNRARLMAIHTNIFSPEIWLNYCFYEYVPTKCDTQNIGVINWEDTRTTLVESESSIEDWYDQNGTIEGMFSYLLHNGCEYGVSGVEY